MKRHLRLSSLEAFAGLLLLARGADAACGGTAVIDGDDGTGAAGGSSSTTSSSTSTSASSGSGGATSHCLDPQPVVVAGQDTGYDVCAGGQYRRRAINSCPFTGVGSSECCGDCPPGFFCAGDFECSCIEACSTDADCGAGQICLCTEPGGVCTSAECTSSAACGPGQDCTSWDTSAGCYFLQFSCTSPLDTCNGDLDCAPGGCYVGPGGTRSCGDAGCAIGRPFLVASEERIAASRARVDWCDDLGARPTREEASWWLRVAAMEHASVAAFARFAAQLLALGAPPRLVADSYRAMADEIRHAQAAYALATPLGATPLGPDTLAIEGALPAESDVEELVRLVIREGCVGETVAALEAAEARPRDARAAATLQTVASDEAEHALLAWRSLRWALDAHREAARPALRREIAELEREVAQPAPISVRPSAHGLASDAERAVLRREALTRAVLPCLVALAGPRGVAASLESRAAQSV